jgi:hypothetical protein
VALSIAGDITKSEVEKRLEPVGAWPLDSATSLRSTVLTIVVDLGRLSECGIVYCWRRYKI